MVVSILSTIAYFNPIITAAINKGIVNDITRSPQVSMFTWQICALVLAPIFTVLLLWPRLGRGFKKGLERRVFEEE